MVFAGVVSLDQVGVVKLPDRPHLALEALQCLAGGSSVRGAVPSLCHSSLPCTGSKAVKNSVPPAAVHSLVSLHSGRCQRGPSERISGHAPYGWDFGSGGLLVENRHEQQIIARMRKLRAQGWSHRGIATRLDREGIRPKQGRQWAHTTVKSILLRQAP